MLKRLLNTDKTAKQQDNEMGATTPAHSLQNIMHGKTMHWRRSKETENKFVYPVLYFSVPITEDIQQNRFFKHNKFSLYSFFDKDHGHKNQLKKTNNSNEQNKPTNSLKQWFYSLLEQASFSDNSEKEQLIKNIKHIQLVTQPRVLGFVFNPVSFWFAYDSKKQLIAVLSEVNNTFGTRFNYLLTVDKFGQIQKSQQLFAQKQLYVSPFFEIQGSYEFKFKLTDGKTHITINYYRNHSTNELSELKKSNQKVTPTLATTLALKHQEFTNKNLVNAFGKYGTSTLLVVARIHWQAIKLKVKGATFFSKKTHIVGSDNDLNMAHSNTASNRN